MKNTGLAAKLKEVLASEEGNRESFTATGLYASCATSLTILGDRDYVLSMLSGDYGKVKSGSSKARIASLMGKLGNAETAVFLASEYGSAKDIVLKKAILSSLGKLADRSMYSFVERAISGENFTIPVSAIDFLRMYQ